MSTDRLLLSEKYKAFIRCGAPVEFLEGTIQFRTIGGKLYKRSHDYVSMNSSLSVKDRGGFSLQPIGETFDVVIE